MTESELTSFTAVPTPVQLELANLFPLRSKEDWTRAIPIYDALPKFLYKSTKRFEEGEKITALVYNHLELPDSRAFDFIVTPGIVADRKGGTQTFLPGEREELVARAIRYLSTQTLTPMGYYMHKKEGPSLRVTFTLHQIIQLLKQWGHTYNSTEIDQALSILSSASLTIYHIGERRKAFFKGTIYADYSGCDDSEDPRDQRRQVILNRLEFDAICSGAYHPLNFNRVMQLRSPLARRLFEYLILMNRNASKPPKLASDPPPPPCKFSSDDVLRYCCIQPQKKFRQTLDRIRRAIIELGESGTLWQRIDTSGTPRYYDEQEILSPATGGRRSVTGINWSVWLSAQAVQEMVESHQEAMPHSDTFTGRIDPVIHKLPEQVKINMRKKSQQKLP
jgi:hypothetical protein